ncbi:heat shock protein [Anaeramoeba flamelloides]|uniref:Heat shock protein n=1 Tax=Anaeramoeba flamelloides TaxID=1746091 RepID=A0ABQ8YTR0_9EUKA|nr:heat shock protein [Anaeramoeba flamelloides]
MYELFVNCYYQNNINNGSRVEVFNQAQSKWNEIKNDQDKVKEYTKNSLGDTETIEELVNHRKKKNLFYSKKTNKILYLKEKYVDSNFDSRSFSKKTKSDRSLKFQKLFQKRFLGGKNLPKILDQDLGFQMILKKSMNNWGELAELFTVYYNGLKRSPQSKSLLAQILDNLIQILNHIKSELKLLIRDTLKEIDSNPIDIINDSNKLKTKVNHMKSSLEELNTIYKKAKPRLRKRIYRQRAQKKDRRAKNQKKDQNNSKKNTINKEKDKPIKKPKNKPKIQKEPKGKQKSKKHNKRLSVEEIKIPKKRKKIKIAKNIKRKIPTTKKPRIQPKTLNNKETGLGAKKESQIVSKINTFDDLLFYNKKNQIELTPVMEFTQEEEKTVEDYKKTFGSPKLYQANQIQAKNASIEINFENEKIFPHISIRKRKKSFHKKDDNFHFENNKNHNFTIHLKKSPNHILLLNKSESLEINQKKNENQYAYIKNEYCNLDKNNNNENFYILNLNNKEWYITAKEILKNNYQLKAYYPLNNDNIKIIYHQIRYAKILIIDDIVDCFNVNPKCKANLEYQLLKLLPIILIRKKETSIIVDIEQFTDPQVFNSFILLEALLNSNTNSMDNNSNNIEMCTDNYETQTDYSNFDLISGNFNLNEIPQDNENIFQFYSQILNDQKNNNIEKKIDHENQIYDWIESGTEKDFLNEKKLTHHFPDFLQDLFQFIKIESKKKKKKNISILEHFQTVNIEKNQFNKKNNNNLNQNSNSSSNIKFIKKKKRLKNCKNNYSQEQNEKEEELGIKKEEKVEIEIKKEIKKELEMGKEREKQNEKVNQEEGHKKDEKMNKENNSQTKKKHLVFNKNISNNLNETNHKIGFCYSHTQIRVLLEFSQMFSGYSSIISCGKLCYFNCNNNIWEPSLDLTNYFQTEFSCDQFCNLQKKSVNSFSVTNSSVIYQNLIIASGYLILNFDDNKKNYYFDQLQREHLHTTQTGDLNLVFRSFKNNFPNIQSNINDLTEIIKKNKKPIISLLVNYDDLEMETTRKSSIYYFGRLWKDLNLEILNIVSYSEKKNLFNPINKMNQILKGILEMKQNSTKLINDNQIELFRGGCLDLIKDLENFKDHNQQFERINQKFISRLKNLTKIFQNTSLNDIHITNCFSKYPNDTPYPYNDYQRMCGLLNTNDCNDIRIHDYEFFCRHLKRSPYLLSFQKCKQLDCSHCNKNPIRKPHIFNLMTQFNNSELIIEPSKSLNFIGHYQTFLEKLINLQNTLF